MDGREQTARTSRRSQRRMDLLGSGGRGGRSCGSSRARRQHGTRSSGNVATTGGAVLLLLLLASADRGSGRRHSLIQMIFSIPLHLLHLLLDEQVMLQALIVVRMKTVEVMVV